MLQNRKSRFKSGVKIKARFHNKLSVTAVVQKLSVSFKLNHSLSDLTVNRILFKSNILFENVNFYDALIENKTLKAINGIKVIDKPVSFVNRLVGNFKIRNVTKVTLEYVPLPQTSQF